MMGQEYTILFMSSHSGLWRGHGGKSARYCLKKQIACLINYFRNLTFLVLFGLLVLGVPNGKSIVRFYNLATSHLSPDLTRFAFLVPNVETGIFRQTTDFDFYEEFRYFIDYTHYKLNQRNNSSTVFHLSKLHMQNRFWSMLPFIKSNTTLNTAKRRDTVPI